MTFAYSTYETLVVERRGPVGWLINNRPDQLNAMNSAMRATKNALWGALEHGLTDACRAGAQELVDMWGHPDQEEGPLAFSERREARWETST